MKLNSTILYAGNIIDHLSYALLLFLPTQIRFWIGGERVMCHGSKLTNSLGRTKLTNSRGKQELDSSVGRVLHRYRKGHGFESQFWPEFFQSGFNFTTAEVVCRAAI